MSDTLKEWSRSIQEIAEETCATIIEHFADCEDVTYEACQVLANKMVMEELLNQTRGLRGERTIRPVLPDPPP